MMVIDTILQVVACVIWSLNGLALGVYVAFSTTRFTDHQHLMRKGEGLRVG